MAHTLAAVMHSGKGRKPRLKDFLPRWSQRRQTADDQLSLLRGLAAMQEGQRRGDDS